MKRISSSSDSQQQQTKQNIKQKEIDIEGIKGHMDCKIDDIVVDVKSASGFSFSKFRQGILREDDPFGYIAQLTAYEEAEGTTDSGFLVINKETDKNSKNIQRI